MLANLLALAKSPITWAIVVGGFFVYIAKAIWRVSAWKSHVDTTLSDLTKKMDTVYGLVLKHFGHPVEQPGSPLNLNDYGKNLFMKTDAGKIVERYADEMYGETEFMNAYQIQEHCFDFSDKRLVQRLEKDDKESFEKISFVAFDAGINMSEITRVIGFGLRNEVFARRGIAHTREKEASPALA